MGLLININKLNFQYIVYCAQIIIKIMEGKLAVRLFIEYIKRITHYANKLELHKRRLADAVKQIQDYIQCFKEMDLDKKGKITPKVIQNYLISKKYYHQPTAISRYYNKYSHEKNYLVYQDVLEALLPNSDFILISHTLTNSSEYANRPSKFTYSCNKERVESIHHITAFVISQEIKALGQDYAMMKNITKNSQRVGAILWRLLDKNHNNSLNYQKIKLSASEIGINIQPHEWQAFLYWHFHSYKQTINRDDFMRVLDVHEERKRATSACRIDQFKVETELFKRAEEEKANNDRIKKAVQEKLAIIPFIGKVQYLNIMREEHFPYELLNTKRELKGKLGYSNPKTMIKYVIERA